MISKIIGALGVIVSDAVDSWATRTTREDLFTIIDEQQDRIRELEDELDRLKEEMLGQYINDNASVHPSSCRGVTPPKTVDPYDHPFTQPTCTLCLNPLIHCNCWQF